MEIYSDFLLNASIIPNTVALFHFIYQRSTVLWWKDVPWLSLTFLKGSSVVISTVAQFNTLTRRNASAQHRFRTIYDKNFLELGNIPSQFFCALIYLSVMIHWIQRFNQSSHLLMAAKLNHRNTSAFYRLRINWKNELCWKNYENDENVQFFGLFFFL